MGTVVIVLRQSRPTSLAFSLDIPEDVEKNESWKLVPVKQGSAVAFVPKLTHAFLEDQLEEDEERISLNLFHTRKPQPGKLKAGKRKAAPTPENKADHVEDVPGNQWDKLNCCRG